MNRFQYLLLILVFSFSSAFCQGVSERGILKTSTQSEEEITVLTIQKRQTDVNTEFGCKNWKLNKKDIEQIMRYARLISSHDFMYLYNVLPCEFKGALKIGDKKYAYTVNAGSSIKLRTRDTTYYYGCSSKECEKYFLSTGGDPIRDLEGE